VLNDLHTFESKDSSYVALQGYQGRVTVNVRVDSIAIDDLPESGGAPTQEQRTAFVRHNIDAIRAMVEKKLEHGDAEPEDCHGRPVLGVRILDTDLAEYMSHPDNRLSYAAFDLRAQSKWIGRDGRFA
jgi:hypothetical protein